MIKNKAYMTEAAKNEIRKMLIKRSLNTPESKFDIALDPEKFDSKGFSIQFGTIESAGITDPITDLSSALGAFTLKLGVEGRVTTLKIPTIPIITSKVVVIIEKVGFYIKDSYDFNGTQPLGFWNVCTNDVGKTPSDGKEAVTNKDYRDWRDINKKGEDARIFSNDWDIVTLSTPDIFDF